MKNIQQEQEKQQQKCVTNCKNTMETEWLTNTNNCR